MNKVAVIVLLLAVATIAAWFATSYFGPARLERQLIASARAELADIERRVKSENPKSQSAEQVFATVLPIVRVELLHTPAPFVFDARTEVFPIPDMGEVTIARYIFTPWRVYLHSVDQKKSIIPSIHYSQRASEPNQSSEPTPTSVTTPAAQEIAPAAVVAHL